MIDVGTKLYIAPEVQSSRIGPRNHAKADMYSLGVRQCTILLRIDFLTVEQIVFFEMNYMFSTRSERIVVIENIRKPGIYFPHDWEARRSRQRQSKSLGLPPLLRCLIPSQ